MLAFPFAPCRVVCHVEIISIDKSVVAAVIYNELHTKYAICISILKDVRNDILELQGVYNAKECLIYCALLESSVELICFPYCIMYG